MRTQQQPTQAGTFLATLRRDVRGNTLAIMAAALIPIAALSGSAIDIARLYVVKVRLQQACDAGVLAGRKFLADSTSQTIDDNARTQAGKFFANNFVDGWMGTSSTVFTPTKTSDYQVAGTATTVVPMTLMKMFGYTTQTIPVTCQARYDVPDVDVMFVLDTTGSMACLPSDDEATCSSYAGSATKVAYQRPSDGSAANNSVAGYPGSTGYAVTEKDGSRIAALRAAVLNFYDNLQSSVDSSTHVRYGFVTYTSTVNAGKAIMSVDPTAMLGGDGNSALWPYQSRYIDPNFVSQYQVSQSSTYDSTKGQSQCVTSPRVPAATSSQPYTFDADSRASVVTRLWDTSVSGSNKCKATTTVYGPIWTYGPASFNVSGFVGGNAVDDPSKLDGTTSRWTGCIEERTTNAGVTSYSSGSLPADLDPDLLATSTDTRWRPMWPEVVYGRNYYGYVGFDSRSVVRDASPAGDTDATAFYGAVATQTTGAVAPRAMNYASYSYNNTTNAMLKSGFSTCGKPVRRLGTMTRSDVSKYVDAGGDFRAIGGTYHDTGMIWGLRMLSPGGMFGADTAAWPGRPAPNRVIVFLTDGDMAPDPRVYGMYGLEYFDRRVTGGDTATTLKDYHNARFLAECAKAKTMNINIWTVSIDTSASSQMQTCATTNAQALFSTSGSDLSDKFGAIAQAVARLRISQ